MIYFTLLIPVLAILILFSFYRDKVTLLEYFFLLIPCLYILVIFNVVSLMYNVYSKEYLGYYVNYIMHDERWNEYVRKTCTKRIITGTDSKGKPIYETESYDCSYVKDHPDVYSMVDNNNNTHHISKSTYYGILRLWGTPELTTKRYHNYYTIDGDLKTSSWDKNMETAVTITTQQNYKNRVRSAPASIFNFEKITRKEKKEYRLYDYPKLVDFEPDNRYIRVQEALMKPDSIDIDPYYQTLFNSLNGYYGKDYQFRTYVMLFTNPDRYTYDKQRSYWKGGNKNEFNICIGIDSLTYKVNWCHVFSWSDDRSLAIDVEQLVESQGRLDLESLYNLLYDEVPKQWKRKNFKDFDYLEIQFSDWQLFIVICLLLIHTIWASIFIVRNDLVPNRINLYKLLNRK